MPLFLKLNIEPEGVVGIWDTTESDEYFLNKMSLYANEEIELTTLKSRKRTEWLSSRYLLHMLSERNIRGACLKDPYGKPYLEDSLYSISISHTSNYTGIIACPLNVGIDIQIIVSKIERIAPKFVSENEYKYIHNQYHIESLHAIWGAKEAMYKAYGKKELDFKKHISVDRFTYSEDGFLFSGEVKKDAFNEKFTLFCQQLDQLILVYAIQQ